MTAMIDRPTHAKDRLVTLQGGWAQFQRIREGCEQTPNIKLAYFNGTKDGVLALHHLRSSSYKRIEQSELLGLADLDLAVLKRCFLTGATSTAAAMKEFNAYLKQQ